MPSGRLFCTGRLIERTQNKRPWAFSKRENFFRREWAFIKRENSFPGPVGVYFDGLLHGVLGYNAGIEEVIKQERDRK